MKCFKKAWSLIRLLVLFFETASKLERFSLNFSIFNPFPSLLSVETNDQKQHKRQNIVLNNKQTIPFWNSVKGKTYFTRNIQQYEQFPVLGIEIILIFWTNCLVNKVLYMQWPAMQKIIFFQLLIILALVLYYCCRRERT